MHKKVVLNADQKTLSCLVKQDKINNVFDVNHAVKLLYGKIFPIKDIVKNTGSNYGLKKAIAFVSFANYLDTATLNLKQSRDIGLINRLKSSGIIQRLSTLFTMGPIFIRTGV